MTPPKNTSSGSKLLSPTKKAPGAPKRFKSSYILFFMHIQDEVKRILPPGTHTAPVVSKKASELWRKLPVEDRLHWDAEAAKEKKRYIAEKESYKGPWLVPHTRAKKDPTAPKRNSSAFLLYSVQKRKEIKKKNPGLKTTDISCMLGKLWRGTTEEIKRPFVKREEIERKIYKEKMDAWKREKEVKDKLLVQTPINDASDIVSKAEGLEEGDSDLHATVTDDVRPLGKDMFTISQAGVPEFPWEDTTRAHNEYQIRPRSAEIFDPPLHSHHSHPGWWNDADRVQTLNHLHDQNCHPRGPAQEYSPSYQHPARLYDYQHYKHPEESLSMQYPSHRYSPISLYRNDRYAFGGPGDPVFRPIPPRPRHGQVNDVTECWERSNSPTHQSTNIAQAISPKEGNTSFVSVVFKHDPLLECSPFGSYDELDQAPIDIFQ